MTITLEGNFFVICPLKLMIDLIVSYSFLNFSYHFLDIIRRSNTFKDLKSTNKGLYETPVSGGNFDGITIKLGIISICPVALSCHSSPSSCLVPREDDGKHLTSCVGQMPNNLPSGQIISNI